MDQKLLNLCQVLKLRSVFLIFKGKHVISRCGLSDGNLVTYGYREKHDIACVVDKIKSLPFISKICLWGRSMGASTVLHYLLESNQKITCICLDSVYLNFQSVIDDKLSGIKMLDYYLIKNLQEGLGFDLRYYY